MRLPRALPFTWLDPNIGSVIHAQDPNLASFAPRGLALLNGAVVKLGSADFDGAAFGPGCDVAFAFKHNRQFIEH